MRAVSSCPEERVWCQLVDGELPAADIEALEKHLAHCRDCWDALERQVAQQRSREATGGRAPSDAAARLVDRLGEPQPDTASSVQEATSDSIPLVRGDSGVSETDFELGPAAEDGSGFQKT